MNRTRVRLASLTGVVLAGILTTATGQIATAQTPAPAALDAAREAFEALPESDRRALQEGLIWSGDYSGMADGTFGRQTYNAIVALQLSAKKPPSGILSPWERSSLQTATQRARNLTGFTVLTDQKTGVQIGVPTKVLTRQDANPSGGTRWQSADGKATLDTRLAPPDATLQSLYERNVAIQTPGRILTYKVLRADFFVITGETPTGKFYTRYAAGPQGIRAFSIGYDKAMAQQFDRVVVAVANSFMPFPPVAAPAVAKAPAAASPAPQAQPHGQRLIGTGLAVGSRRVVTTAAIEACNDVRAFGVKPQSVTGKGTFVLEFAEDLRAKPVAMAEGAIEEGAPLLAVAFSDDGGRPALTATPGLGQSTDSLAAPLQPGASGAPVLNAQGALVGLVGPVSADQRNIAGLLPTARHALVSVSEIRKAAPDLAGKPGQPAAQKLRAADIAASVRDALVPITCGP